MTKTIGARLARKAYSELQKWNISRAAVNSFRDAYDRRRLQRRGYYSQHGEDKFFLEYFGRDYIGTYVDIGASHAFRLSNTYMLYQSGWRGICVDPIKHLMDSHAKWRPSDTQLHAGVSKSNSQLEFFEMMPSVLSTFDAAVAQRRIEEGNALLNRYTIGTYSLAEIIQRNYARTNQVDLLTIDVEGYDYEVLASNDWEAYRPRLVVFENNDENDNRSDLLLIDRKYRKIKSFACNSIYEDLL